MYRNISHIRNELSTYNKKIEENKKKNNATKKKRRGSHSNGSHIAVHIEKEDEKTKKSYVSWIIHLKYHKINSSERNELIKFWHNFFWRAFEIYRIYVYLYSMERRVSLYSFYMWLKLLAELFFRLLFSFFFEDRLVWFFHSKSTSTFLLDSTASIMYF